MLLGAPARGERLSTLATEAGDALGTRRVRTVIELLAECWQPARRAP